MRAKIATGAAIATIAVAGTAVAAGGGGPVGGLFGDDRQEELAQDLAQQLDGVSPNEVEQALEAVGEENMEERRTAMAEAIAAELDGVDSSAVADALAKHEEQARASIENGERPEMGSLVTTLADELGKSEDEVTAALEAANDKQAEERQAEMLEKLDEAVANGDVTEEQADQIRERIESGHSGHGGPRGPGGPGGHGGPGGPGFGPDEAGSGGDEEGASAPTVPLEGSAA